MPTDLNIRTPEKSFNKDLTCLSPKDKSNDVDEDELSTAFRDLRISAFSKAANISPVVTSVTLGANSTVKDTEDSHNVTIDESSSSLHPTALHTSTPEKVNPGNSVRLRKLKEFLKMKQKAESLSPITPIESKINVENNVSYQKLLNEIDIQRRLTVDKVMRERIQNLYDTNKMIRDNLDHLKQTKHEEAIARRLLLERKILDDIHEQEILNKPKREAEWAKVSLKEAQRIQERNQRVKEAEEEARRKSESILIKRKQTDEILNLLQKEYNKEYKNMLESLKECKDKVALTSAQSKIIKDCNTICEKLFKKCKQGDINEEDVESAKKLVETMKMLHEKMSKEIERINEELKMKKEESEKKVEVQEVPVQKDEEAKSAPPAPGSDLSDCFDPRSLETYMKLKSVIENWEKTIEPLTSDDELKKFKFNCKKAVNIPVNAISPVSGLHLSDKYSKLHNLLSGRIVEVGDVKISATAHPLGVPYCKYLLAKKFVRQGDLTVSSKPDAAFSIAAVLASLWVDFPDFGELVLAHFQMACPYLAPVFLPQVEGQSDEEYHKSLGYQYSQNGEVEKQDSFLKRMSGIMRLYAAILISHVRQSGKMNPLGLSEGWRWISSLLNLEPRPDICATLLYDFLDVAGHEMFRAYGGQFKKLLAYICQEYFPKLEKVTPSSAGGPMVRLEGFLQKVLKEESIPPPHGVLPPNFW